MREIIQLITFRTCPSSEITFSSISKMSSFITKVWKMWRNNGRLFKFNAQVHFQVFFTSIFFWLPNSTWVTLQKTKPQLQKLAKFYMIFISISCSSVQLNTILVFLLTIIITKLSIPCTSPKVFAAEMLCLLQLKYYNTNHLSQDITTYIILIQFYSSNLTIVLDLHSTYNI